MRTFIDLAAVVKRYGRTVALDGLDLQVEPGEVHAFLGPNGAGKSTTLRVVLGAVRADGGTAHVFGLDPWHRAHEVHARLAYVPGDVSLWPELTGGQALDLLAALRGGDDPARRADLVDRFDLDPSRRCRTYSKGNRQKVALVSALSATADLYVLDEPTTGLDPLMEEVFRSCVRELRGTGAAVLLSSHVLAEAEALADRISIVRAGRVVETGTLVDLRGLTATVVQALLPAPPTGLADLDGVHDLDLTPDPHVPGRCTVRARVEPAALAGVVRSLGEAGPLQLVCRQPTLEELFLDRYAADDE